MEVTFYDFCNRVNEDRKREIKEAVDRAPEITGEMLEDILDILCASGERDVLRQGFARELYKAGIQVEEM